MKRLEARQEGENVYRIVDPAITEWRKKKLKIARKLVNCMIIGCCIVYLIIALISSFVALAWGFNLNAVSPNPTFDTIIVGFLIAGALVGSCVFVVTQIMCEIDI